MCIQQRVRAFLMLGVVHRGQLYNMPVKRAGEGGDEC
jgi:hypothetical protein